MLSRDWRTFEAENVNSGPRLQIILFIVYLATIPIFVYHVFNYMSWPLVPIWHLSAILLGLHVLRNVLTKFFEFVFNLKGVYQIWLESYSWIHFTLGVLFFPLAVLVTYSPEVTISFCANLALILFLLSEMLLFYRLCVVFCNSLASLFYLFLYLCTLEIIPLLIVFRILS